MFFLERDSSTKDGSFKIIILIILRRELAFLVDNLKKKWRFFLGRYQKSDILKIVCL